MKKIYIKPNMLVIPLKMQSCLLAGSPDEDPMPKSDDTTSEQW